jgi:ElaB/YqjD/DUF883 family membrane-anchored ribosome-binding protein
MPGSNGTTAVNEPAKWRMAFDRAKAFGGKTMAAEHAAATKVAAAIKKYPLAAVTIAIGAGFVFGRLLRRR